MTPPEKKLSNGEILDAVYRHGVRESVSSGSRGNIPELPADEMTIATALKILNQKDNQHQAELAEKDNEIKRLGRIKGTQTKPCFCNGCTDTIPNLQAQLATLRGVLEKIAKEKTDCPSLTHCVCACSYEELAKSVLTKLKDSMTKQGETK